ncbi:hypothetical protein NM688_g2953 [Phlebia brevispora]|uniref:Uncharacterized protein n=1 Tax=Phlebia brevispora TaxID=194682 RepID=A0ACC1T785_9APHY|nr:hypothetical protein NM688_g2953 [Phlebia brevispora]
MLKDLPAIHGLRVLGSRCTGFVNEEKTGRFPSKVHQFTAVPAASSSAPTCAHGSIASDQCYVHIERTHIHTLSPRWSLASLLKRVYPRLRHEASFSCYKLSGASRTHPNPLPRYNHNGAAA